MEVVKSGKSKLFKITCESCQSDLNYVRDDVFEASGGYTRIGRTTFALPPIKVIKCPICEEKIKPTWNEVYNG